MKHCSRFAVTLALVLAILMLITACQTTVDEPAQEASQGAAAAATPEATQEPAAARENEERYGGNFILASSSLSNTMDAHWSALAMGNYQWMELVYETPLALDETNNFQGQACDFEYSEDGLTLKLTVKPDRVFSDGTPLTIEDVVASIERAAKGSDAFKTNFFDNIADAKIEGDSVTYTFAKFNALALSYISDIKGPCYIMKKELVDRLGAEGKVESIEDVIGSGCYVLSEYTPDVQIVLDRNENYMPIENEFGGPAGTRYAYFDTITFATNTDTASRTAGMIAGDYSYGAVSTEMGPYAEKIGLKSVLKDNLWTHAIFFNLSKEYNGDSIVQNVYFRKAVRAALNCEEIMMSVADGDLSQCRVNSSPMDPNNIAYYNTILDDAEWNIANQELAKQYLAQSGYNGETIVWLTHANGAFYKAAVIGIEELQAIGINVELKAVDNGSHSAMRGDPSTGYDIGAWEVQQAQYSPLQSNNLVVGTAGGAHCWVSEDRDALLEIMRNTKIGSAESVQAYKDLCTLWSEEVPWIIFGTKMTLTYTQPNVVLDMQGLISYYWNSYFTE